MSFVEPCDTIDSAVWGINWDTPTAVGGEWVFNIPIGFTSTKQIFHRLLMGYGVYEIRMRSPPRVSGVNWWFFLYTAPNGEGQPGHNSIIMTQVQGSRAYYASEAIVGFRVDGKASPNPNVGYWTIPCLAKYGVNFEDGNPHTFRYEYSADDFVIYVDGIQIFRWSVDCANTSELGIPFPPMTFIIGAKGEGTQTSEFTLAIDSVSYTPSAIELPPVVTSFSINNGEPTVAGQSVTLNNICSNSPTEYIASESATFAGASWLPYSTAPTFILSAGSGMKTVHFMVRNASGESSIISDTITVEATQLPPTVTAFSINNDAISTDSQTVYLNNACTESPTDYMASEDQFFTGGVWLAYSNAPVFQLSAGNGDKTVYFKVRNPAGESVSYSYTITLDTTVPPQVDWKWIVAGLGFAGGALLLLGTGKKGKKK